MQKQGSPHPAPRRILPQSISLGESPVQESKSVHEGLEEFIQIDAERLRRSFKQAFEKVYSDTQRPHVLILGTAGAGKSSIINTVFGSEMAVVGVGRPVTQNFIQFKPENTPIVLYDSQGIEAGMQLNEFIHKTTEYFQKAENIVTKSPNNQMLPSSDSLASSIHLVWYVINAATGRFQDFEESICRELISTLPVIFILNKCDLATEEQLHSLQNLIEDLELPNCLGILETVTSKYAKEYPVEYCTTCHTSNELVTINKLKLVVCESCGEQIPFQKPKGLETVLQLTFDVLPSIAKESFVASQKYSFEMKERRTKKIITDFYEEQETAFTPQGLTQLISKMFTRITFVWGFKDHGHLLGSHLAKGMLHSFSIQDTLFLLIQRNYQRTRATAIGVIWNRCVRQLAKMLLMECVEEIEDSQIAEHWTLILEECFQHLNEKEIGIMEQSIDKFGLEEVLKAEDNNAIYCEEVTSKCVETLLRRCTNRIRASTVSNDIRSPEAWKSFLSIGNRCSMKISSESTKTNSQIHKLIQSDAKQEVKSGFLTKRGQVVKSWKIRFFVLWTNGELEYYRSTKRETALGIVNVKEIVRMEDKPTTPFKKGWAFSMVLPQRTLILHSECEEYAKDWQETIRLVSGYLDVE